MAEVKYISPNNLRRFFTGIKNLLSVKQDTLTFDTTPTSGSSNPVTSGGVHAALAGKQDTLTFDTAPTSGSSNPVTSDGLYFTLTDYSTDSYTTSYGVSVKVYRIGILCFLSIEGTPSGLATGWKSLCTIGSEFRPSFSLPYGIGMTQGNNNQKYNVDIKNTGEVRINALNSTVSAYVRYMTVYPVTPA